MHKNYLCTILTEKPNDFEFSREKLDIEKKNIRNNQINGKS